MAGAGVFQLHRGVVLVRNFEHDGQAQSGAVGFGAQRAVEQAEVLGHLAHDAGIGQVQHQLLQAGGTQAIQRQIAEDCVNVLLSVPLPE